MRNKSAVLGSLLVATALVLVAAAATLLLWATVMSPYGKHSVIYVVSPVLALVYAALALFALRIAWWRRQR